MINKRIIPTKIVNLSNKVSIEDLVGIGKSKEVTNAVELIKELYK